MTEETTTQEIEQADQVTQLSIQDLYNIRAIIDIASTRGAFRAGELKTVGETYNRLNAFLLAVEANSAAEAREASEEDVATEVVEGEEPNDD